MVATLIPKHLFLLGGKWHSQNCLMKFPGRVLDSQNCSRHTGTHFFKTTFKTGHDWKWIWFLAGFHQCQGNCQGCRGRSPVPELPLPRGLPLVPLKLGSKNETRHGSQLLRSKLKELEKAMLGQRMLLFLFAPPSDDVIRWECHTVIYSYTCSQVNP